MVPEQRDFCIAAEKVTPSAVNFMAKYGRGLICLTLTEAHCQQLDLPLRTYSAAMFFKNGVPSGYVEVLSLFEQAEVGFNLYYTFREGESAWLYARVMRGRAPFSALERWQTSYLPVYSFWALIVVAVFPLAFGFA